MSKVEEILTTVENLTVLELSDLVKKLEEKFGVSAAAPMMVAAVAGGEAAEVKDEFDVILASAGDKKIQVLKVLHEVTGLGLQEVKNLVDTAPKPIKQGVKKPEAEEIKKKIEAEGGKVEIK
ncbi:50S ribosomal protein L7/L12 [Candidatus Saganbacteria bacterium CG08_land_8_20_14_0_20_45_16]|uniref:Large ribosomal subunit protein bL12 n=1 Tax=Candidatus Saganbacteria bacterium CG08_land_8_20_14_0_20_45_16 TaxID=2014293 RepID=A0A2H0XXD1_UNCSA|nr:MAG: 50S ribosomal protein L7/L12 [Candidatus Saganbacteria bacterium CG08_land_8_20_14_0_20_45_16]